MLLAGTTAAQEVQPLPANPLTACTADKLMPPDKMQLAAVACKSPALASLCCKGLDAALGRHSPSAG